MQGIALFRHRNIYIYIYIYAFIHNKFLIAKEEDDTRYSLPKCHPVGCMYDEVLPLDRFIGLLICSIRLLYIVPPSDIVVET